MNVTIIDNTDGKSLQGIDIQSHLIVICKVGSKVDLRDAVVKGFLAILATDGEVLIPVCSVLAPDYLVPDGHTGANCVVDMSRITIDCGISEGEIVKDIPSENKMFVPVGSIVDLRDGVETGTNFVIDMSDITTR